MAVSTPQVRFDSFSVPLDHPALPGHFPGNPLVPGVLIVDRVIDLAEDWLARQIDVVGLPQAKFVSPLRPGEKADVRLSLDGATLRFTVSREAVVIGSGILQLQGPPAP